MFTLCLILFCNTVIRDENTSPQEAERPSCPCFGRCRQLAHQPGDSEMMYAAAAGSVVRPTSGSFSRFMLC